MAAKPTKVSIVISAVDELSGKFKEINKNVQSSPLFKLNNSIVKLGDAAGLKQLTRSFGGVKNAVGDVIGEVSKLALGVGGAIAGTAAFLVDFGKKANDIKDTAAKLGVSTGFLQELQGAAQLTGASVEGATSSFEKFSKITGEAAAGMGEGRVAFEALGVSLRDPTGKLRNFESLLPEVVEKLSKINNASVRNAVGSKLFGRSFQELVPVFKNGSKGLLELQARVRELGGVMDGKALEAGDGFAQLWQELSISFGGAKKALAMELIPVFRDGMTQLANFFVNNKNQVKAWGQALSSLFVTIIPAALNAFQSLVGFFSYYNEETGKTEANTTRIKLAFIALGAVTLAPLVTSIITLGGALGSLALNVMAFLPKVLLLIKGLGSLLATFFGMLTPIGWVVVGVTALAALGTILYKKWEPFRNLIDSIWSGIKSIGSAAGAFFGFGGDTATTTGAPGVNQAAGALGARALIAPTAPGGVQKTQAEIKVNFDNMPRGTRVESQSEGSASIDVSRGYSFMMP